jgi:hypothetical protein
MAELTMCCEQMRAQVEHSCVDHPRRGQCPDQVVGYDERFDEYGIWLRTGEDASASSWLTITFCPWCGADLPPTRRDEWFERVDALGVDPDDAPPELTTYGWWLEPGSA